MSDHKSKFDVRGHGLLAEFKHTLLFAAYVVITFLAWLLFGWVVRRAYRKALKEGRPYYVDRLPSGRNNQ